MAHQWHRIIKTVSFNATPFCNLTNMSRRFINHSPLHLQYLLYLLSSLPPLSLFCLFRFLCLLCLFCLNWNQKLRHTMEPHLIPTSAERHLKLFFPIANAQLTCNAFNGQNGGESPADWLRAGIWDGHFGILLRRRRWTIQFLIS